MKRYIPSFQVQIILLVLFLLINAVLFYRNYFLENLTNFTTGVESLDLESHITKLHTDYTDKLPVEDQKDFRQDVESLLEAEHQIGLSRDLFRKDIELYSYFIFVFLSLAALTLFFLSFSLISRPLKRLQLAAASLAAGDWSIQVRENRFSPLNDLIVSFNRMVTELESGRNKLVRAEKELAWREMARVMAHEIKNPLTPIRLSLDRLETKYKEGSDQIQDILERVLSVIREEVTNLQTLAGEFSQFARLPEAELRPLELHHFLNDILEPYRSSADIQYQFSNEPLTLLADRIQFKQVIVNLVQNGIQASGESPVITLTTEKDGNQVKIGIADKGKGIEPDQLNKIFEPYYTRREKGTGLGLAIVKRIVENHNGTIQVESEPGKGSVFMLRFPLSQAIKETGKK